MIDFIFGLKHHDVIVYDIETFKYCFTFYAQHVDTDEHWYFEISKYRNDYALFKSFINQCRAFNVSMVGFNNVGFDYPVVHWTYAFGNQVTSQLIHERASYIIKSDSFNSVIWPNDRLVEQIDLYLIHHFNNKARSTSLKVLEFNMRMDNIEDLPFQVDQPLTRENVKVLRNYNIHDVKATKQFYHESKDKIEFRRQLSKQYDKDFINHNDTKIGKDYFIMKLEESGIPCFTRRDGQRVPRQTLRPVIPLKDVIFDYVSFQEPEFNRILTWFKQQEIKETKGVFKDVHCTVNGFQFDFGTGGIHGSVESSIIESTSEEVIVDIDVASYYPNLSIANNLYPEHLSAKFCDIYSDMYHQREQYDRTHDINRTLKFALNGVYGDSNNKYSPFYDPQYTMSITINGQLLLCMLAEQLMKSPTCKLIQINTDGLTMKLPRNHVSWLREVCRWWERLTKLTLEEAFYNRMYIRDVNNYIAEYETGELKRKGAYEYDLAWHQNQSALIVQKAAEACLVRGIPVDETIVNHVDHMDFMLRAKVPRSSKLFCGKERVQNTTRYVIAKQGGSLTKVMPPKGPEGQYKKANGIDDYAYEQWHRCHGNVWSETIHTKNKSVYQERSIDINTGWVVQVCNDMKDFDGDINYQWYIKEASKLCQLENRL